MERCLEEISSTVLDAGEPISYRTLSIHCQVPANVSVEARTQFSAENSSVKALQVLVKRVIVDNNDKSETAAAKRDPRARVLSLEVGSQCKSDNVLHQQIYALYNKPKAAAEDEDEVEAVAIACWAQERQARNDVFDTVTKQAPLSAAVKALYASGIKCAEATVRQDFGEQGEETVSAFDAINASAKKKTLSFDSLSSYNKSSNKAVFFKVSSSSRNGDSKVTDSRKQETKKLDMSNVVTVDSDDEDEDDDDDDTDAPMFCKTASNKRIISDDDDGEDEAPSSKETGPPASKSRNVKRKLNASPAETKEANQAEESDGEGHSNKKLRMESEDEADDAPVEEPVLGTKRRVLVTKTRINEQGYMITEKTYEEVELTAEEIEKEQKAAKMKLEEEKKKKAAAEKAAKAKKEKQSGPPKQRDLRSFFSTK